MQRYDANGTMKSPRHSVAKRSQLRIHMSEGLLPGARVTRRNGRRITLRFFSKLSALHATQCGPAVAYDHGPDVRGGIYPQDNSTHLAPTLPPCHQVKCIIAPSELRSFSPSQQYYNGCTFTQRESSNHRLKKHKRTEWVEERRGKGHVHTIGARRKLPGQVAELGPTKWLRMRAFPIFGRACRRRILQICTESKCF